MSGFNFIEAAGNGYKFVWEQRRALVHYGLWPMLLKVSSFVIVTGLGYDKNLLRQGLVLLPAYFLEGWLVAYAIRFALFAERRPEPLNNRDMSPGAVHRRRCILGGMIIYLLTKLATSLIAGMTIGVGDLPAPGPMPQPTPGMFFALLVLLMIGVWCFRLFWLHVPVIIGVSTGRFLWLIRGFGASVNMLALWILCMLPPAMLILAFVKMLTLFIPGAEGDTPSLFYVYVLSVLQGGMETIVAVVANVAMAHGVREILLREGGRT